MKRLVTVGFRNLGWRSWLTCSLCAECPDSDQKGCCCYSPVLRLAELGLLQRDNPQILRDLLEMPHLTILDYSVTVESVRCVDNTRRCQFHSCKGGCVLPVEFRESVCRRYVCAGTGLWEQAGAKDWTRFFDELEVWEAGFNQELEQELRKAGITLRGDHDCFFAVLGQAFERLYQPALQRIPKPPEEENLTFSVDVSDWIEWQK